jgi:chaperonin GroES
MNVLRDLVLIKADEAKKQTASGLLIHEEWQTLPPTGEVLAVGPLVTTVKAGDRVLFERYAAIMPKGKDDPERICQESHIMGIFNED